MCYDARAVLDALFSAPPPSAEMYPDVPNVPLDLPPDWRELYEERAAIMEFDGNLPRERAEQLALADILALMDGSGRKPRSEVA